VLRTSPSVLPLRKKERERVHRNRKSLRGLPTKGGGALTGESNIYVRKWSFLLRTELQLNAYRDETQWN